MMGTLTIAGLGPGDDALVTPEVSAALAEATDVLGYAPYVARVPPRDGLTLHPSDNRKELQRAGEALQLAAEGRSVVVVSSGDPGVFAMASAVFEALEAAPELQDLSIRVLPGVTAMLAAAARAGAPLGHDFCAINLSDNLKPWPVDREAAAARGGSRLRDRALQSALGEPAGRFCPRARHPARGRLRRSHHHLCAGGDDAEERIETLSLCRGAA